MRSPVILASIIFALGLASAAWIYQPEILDYTVTVPSAQGRATTTLSYGGKPLFENYSFFQQVEREFLEQKAKFISVDLANMELSYFEDGEEVLHLSVQAKGSRGSWWQTPPGLYKIRTKEQDHITSFGELHMPWSMQFHGNFFIHGWPYFPNGRRVTGESSAGCIRLSQEDAKTLFRRVGLGTPVLIYDEQVRQKETEQTFTSAVMDVSSSRYLVADLATNQVLVQQRADVPGPASVLSYLMTVLVAAEHYDIEGRIYVNFNKDRDSEQYGEGPYRIYDTFFAILRDGSWEAADALARYRGTERFTGYMNDQARAVGMNDTVFSEPGVFPQNTTSPEDMFALIKHIYSYRAFLLTIAADDLETSVYGTPRILPSVATSVVEHDEFFGGLVIPPERFDDATAAVGVYTISFDGSEGYPVVFIAMDSERPVEDIRHMHQAIKQQFSIRRHDPQDYVIQEDESSQSYIPTPATLESQAVVLEAVRSFLNRL